MLRAYNDWHIDEWCGTHPGRFIPLSIPPIWDPQLMADEVRRVAEKGCRGHLLREPREARLAQHPQRPLGPVLDRLLGRGHGRVPAHRLVVPDGDDLVEAPINVMITPAADEHRAGGADLLWSQVFRKFPDVRFALSEGGIGWIPYFLERTDYVYQHHRAWTGADFGDQLPSQVFREHHHLLHRRRGRGGEPRPHRRRQHQLGVRLPPLGLDVAELARTSGQELAGVPDDEVRLITHENAMRDFQYDPFAHREGGGRGPRPPTPAPPPPPALASGKSRRSPGRDGPPLDGRVQNGQVQVKPTTSWRVCVPVLPLTPARAPCRTRRDDP